MSRQKITEAMLSQALEGALTKLAEVTERFDQLKAAQPFNVTVEQLTVALAAAHSSLVNVTEQRDRAQSQVSYLENQLLLAHANNTLLRDEVAEYQSGNVVRDVSARLNDSATGNKAALFSKSRGSASPHSSVDSGNISYPISVK